MVLKFDLNFESKMFGGKNPHTHKRARAGLACMVLGEYKLAIKKDEQYSASGYYHAHKERTCNTTNDSLLFKPNPSRLLLNDIYG